VREIKLDAKRIAYQTTGRAVSSDIRRKSVDVAELAPASTV